MTDDDDNNKGDRNASTLDEGYDDDAHTASSFCDRVAHYEWLLCGMGDLWGKLQSRESLLAWWLARHAAYFGFMIGLVIWVPASAFFLVPLFLVAHLYKIGRFLVQSSLQKRQENRVKLRRTSTTPSLKQPRSLATSESHNIGGRPRVGKETAEMVDIEAAA